MIELSFVAVFDAGSVERTLCSVLHTCNTINGVKDYYLVWYFTSLVNLQLVFRTLAGWMQYV